MSENYKKFFQYAGDAMDFMAKHGISPRPMNYHVWFEHAAHSTPALNTAVENLQNEKQPLDENASANLHSQFFVKGAAFDNAILAAGDQLSEKLTSAIELIKAAGAGTQNYGDTLVSISSDLGTKEGDELTGSSLQSVVDTLVSATKEMSEHSSKLEKQLRENSDEVDLLKKNLEQTKTEALTDPLTKLGNRKHFDIELEKAAASAAEGDKPLCLVIADIDHFKAFNDSWGHQTGDQVLRLVSACIKNDIRDGDVSARYGGEEFVLVLADTSLEVAAEIANKIRKTVKSKKVMKRSTGQDLGTITISMGVAQYRQGEPLTGLIERADECLYVAKESGRNCVVDEQASAEAQKAG